MAVPWVQQEASEITATGDAAHQLPSIDSSGYATFGCRPPDQEYIQVAAAARIVLTIPHDDTSSATQILPGDTLKVAIGFDDTGVQDRDVVAICSRVPENMYLYTGTVNVGYEQGFGVGAGYLGSPVIGPQEQVLLRLEEFREMENGWLGKGFGIAPRDVHLTWLSQMVKGYYPSELPLPRTYPTPDGNIEMEWSEGDYCAILEIDMTSRSGHLYLLGDDDDDDAEPQIVDLESADGWRRISDSVCASAV